MFSILTYKFKFSSICVVLLIMHSTTGFSQKQNSVHYLRQHPVWINMMEDSLANFFETERAFGLYFSVHSLPKEEDEIIGTDETRNERNFQRERSSRILRLFPRKRDELESQMAFFVKKYRHWHLLTRPWVREDGSLIGPMERKFILENLGR